MSSLNNCTIASNHHGSNLVSTDGHFSSGHVMVMSPGSPDFGSSTERPNDRTASISASLVRKSYLEPSICVTSLSSRYGYVMIFRGFGYLESTESTCFCFSRLRCPASTSIGYLYYYGVDLQTGRVVHTIHSSDMLQSLPVVSRDVSTLVKCTLTARK